MEAKNDIFQSNCLALSGQIWMHRIQEMHRFLLVLFGCFLGIALVGHFSAQMPQLRHFLFAFGFKGTPEYSL